MTAPPEGGTLLWRRDPEQLEAGLAAWARHWAGPTAALADVRVPGNGMSNDTALFRVDGRALVARLAPAPDAPYATFPVYDIDLQERVIGLVRDRTDVPAPEIVHVERDDAWLGVPFIVFAAVEGEVPSDSPPYLVDPNGWFLQQGGPEQWRRMEEETIDVLVRLHRIPDDDATAFLRPAVPGDTALARQLAYQRTYHDWARDGIDVPVLERAFSVLSATLPSTTRSVLNWGDSRPGNIIYRDFAPAAVLDWEMATVGPPEVDLAWSTFFHRFFAGMVEPYGITVPAMFDPVDAVATYERRGGEPLEDLTWYEAFAGYRFGIILTRMSLRSIAFGTGTRTDDPDDLVMFAPLLHRLLDRL